MPRPAPPRLACAARPDLALPGPAVPSRAMSGPAVPCLRCPSRPCLARPSLAIPGHALPARPGLASPSRAWPRHALPCHALDLRELAQHQQQIVTDWQMRFPRQPCIRLLFRFEHPDANDRCRSLVDAFEFPPFGFVYTHAGKPTPFCKQLQHPCRRNSANPCLVNKNSPRARRNPGAKRTNLTGLFTLR